MNDSEIATREYVDLRLQVTRGEIKLLNKGFKQYERNQDKALGLAYSDIADKLEKMNKLRDEVIEDRTQYITKAEHEAMRKGDSDRITALEKWQNKLLGIAIVLAAISAFIGSLITKVFFSVR